MSLHILIYMYAYTFAYTCIYIYICMYIFVHVHAPIYLVSLILTNSRIPHIYAGGGHERERGKQLVEGTCDAKRVGGACSGGGRGGRGDGDRVPGEPGGAMGGKAEL